MTQPVTVTFGGRSSVTNDPSFLRVTLLNRPYAGSAEPWDRELIECEVSVQVDAFKGRYPTAIWGHELAFMRAVLTALNERAGQEAEGFIGLIENAFDIKLVLTPLGHLTLKVVARGHPGMGPDLHFSMEADRSHLPLWINQLDKALAAFPAEVPVDVSDPIKYRGSESTRE